MIEKLGKGEISYKEARELLREEKKALSAVSKHLFGFKTSPVAPAHFPVASLAPKAPKAKRSATQRASSPPRAQYTRTTVNPR
jgi:hypothetical protein